MTLFATPDQGSPDLRNIDWFEVTHIRGAVPKSGDLEFQVEVRIGFRLEGDPGLVG